MVSVLFYFKKLIIRKQTRLRGGEFGKAKKSESQQGIRTLDRK